MPATTDNCDDIAQLTKLTCQQSFYFPGGSIRRRPRRSPRRGVRLSAPVDRLWPAASVRTGGRPAGGGGAGRRAACDVDGSIWRRFGGSALTAGIDVPKDAVARGDGKAGFRSLMCRPATRCFSSLALAYAEVLGAADIFIGVNAIDYSGYPDCRPEFIAAFERLANLATKAGVEGTLRFRDPRAADRYDQGRRSSAAASSWGSTYGLTHSCYDPDPAGRPCGSCDACLLRRQGFAEAGMADPLLESDRQADPARHAHRRNLSLVARRRAAHGHAERLCARQRLQSALLVLRHAVYVMAARGSGDRSCAVRRISDIRLPTSDRRLPTFRRMTRLD